MFLVCIMSRGEAGSNTEASANSINRLLDTAQLAVFQSEDLL